MADTTATRPDEISIANLFATVWKARWPIVVCGLIGFVASIFYISTMTQTTYRAHSVVRLDVQELNVVDVVEVFNSGATDVFGLNTELQVIQSDPLIAELVDRLDLERSGPFDRSGSHASVLGNIRASLTGVELAPLTPEKKRQLTMSAVRAALSVKRIRDTYLVEIRFETPNPDLSAQMANTLAEIYIEQGLAEKQNATKQAAAWLSVEVEALTRSLFEEDRQIAILRASIQSNSEAELKSDTDEIRDIRARLADLERRHARHAETISVTTDLKEQGAFQRLARYLGDPTLLQLAARIDAGDAEALGPASARVATLRDDYQALLMNTEAQIAALTEALETLEQSLEKRAADLNRLEQTERARNDTLALQERFSGRLRETTLQLGLLQPNASLLEPAQVPINPSGPQWLQTIVFVTATASAFGAFLHLLVSTLRPGITDRRGGLAATGRPVAGVIPSFGVSDGLDLVKLRVALSDADVSDALRELRTAILRAPGAEMPRVIGLTSTNGHEDLAPLAIGLSSVFATRECARVLLINCDFRTGTLAALDRELGDAGTLAEVLSDGTPLADATGDAKGFGFSFLRVGASDIDPMDAFASARFYEVIQEARAQFDHIVIAFPPLGVAADVTVAPTVCDRLIYAVRWKHTLVSQVLRGIRRIDATGAPVFALALTRAPARWNLITSFAWKERLSILRRVRAA